jgi:hypothetical protein
MIIYVYMDVDSTFGVVLQMWDPEAVRQRWSGSQPSRTSATTASRAEGGEEVETR